VTTIRAVVQGRRIELPAPADLPDGTEVLVDLTPVSGGRIGLTEAEWRDDPAALADWAAWLGTIEPVAFAEDDAFAAEVARLSREAVRKQMAEGGQP
jgi:hypothetical protein